MKNELPAAVFRVVKDGKTEIKQWRDSNIPGDEWKNVSKDKEPRKYKQEKRCDLTIDMFEPRQEELLP